MTKPKSPRIPAILKYWLYYSNEPWKTKWLYEFCKTINFLELDNQPLHHRNNFPEFSGIYFAYDSSNNKLYYIGRTKDFRRRWFDNRHHKLKRLLEIGNIRVSFWIHCPLDSLEDLKPMEAFLIHRLKPEMNSPAKTRLPNELSFIRCGL